MLSAEKSDTAILTIEEVGVKLLTDQRPLFVTDPHYIWGGIAPLVLLVEMRGIVLSLQSFKNNLYS
jgi:hypothetical protein